MVRFIITDIQGDHLQRQIKIFKSILNDKPNIKGFYLC